MEEILIQGGRVIDPGTGRDGILDLLVRDGKVQDVAENITAPDARVIDASGKVVAPGFIDLHVHFREPGLEYKESIETGAQSAAAGGFSAACCMANTSPVNDNASVTRLIIDQARKAGAARVYPIGAVTRIMAGKELSEIGEMKEAGIVALSDDGKCVLSPQILRHAMEYADMFGLVIVEHCEDETARGGYVNEGEVSARYGMKGMPASAEESIAARDINLAEYTGLPVHLAHISTRGTVALVRAAKKRGVRVTCEAAPHHWTLTEKELEAFDADYKMNPPLRSQEDVDAIKEGLMDGTIDCIATDHAPHAPWEKEMELDIAPFGIVGLETALPLSLNLVEAGLVSLPQMVELLTLKPAEIFNLPGGRLNIGEVADICIFDPDREWMVEPEKFLSKGRNTPFKGQTLKGKNLCTIVGGSIVYNGGEL